MKFQIVRHDRKYKLRRNAYIMGYYFGRDSVGPLVRKHADHGHHMREHWNHLIAKGDVRES